MADLRAVNVLLDDENDLQPQSDEDSDAQADNNDENDLRVGEKDDNELKSATDDGNGDQTDGGKNDLQEGEDKEENDLREAADDGQGTDKTVENQRLCGLCDVPVPTTATNCFCVQCAMYLCRSCVQSHRKIPITKQHTIADAAEESTEECSEEYSYCTRHVHVQLKYYCTACKLPICAECQIVNHRQHDITEIEQEVEAVKSRLGKARELTQARLTDEQKTRDELETKLSDFVTHQRTVEQDLERRKQSRLSNIQQSIEQSYAEVEKANEKLCAEYTTEIEEALEQIDQRIRQLNQSADELAQLAHSNRTKTDYVCLVIPDLDIDEDQETKAVPCPQLIQQVGNRRNSIGSQTENGSTPRDAGVQTFSSTSREMAVQTSGSAVRDIGSQTSDGASQNRSMETCERCVPEGQIRYRASNVEQFQPRVWHHSHEVIIRNVPWQIVVERYKPADGDYLLFGIECDRNETLPLGFRVRASYSLRLIHPTTRQQTKEKKYTHTFTKDVRVWGNPEFHPWQGLVDDGFISDGGIQLEATIKVLEASHSLPCPDCR